MVKRSITLGLLTCLFVLVGVFLLPSLATATTGLNGPVPPQVGDPVGADISPHGGYSATSAYCLQCHNIHGTNGEYALMYQSNVTSTCETCHSLFGGAPTGARTPVGVPPKIPGTASSRSAYDNNPSASGHSIGTVTSPLPDSVTITESDWTYNWTTAMTAGTVPDATTPAGPGTASDLAGGLYCASCHTPHGTWGYAVNTKKYWSEDETGVSSTLSLRNWQEGGFLYWSNPCNSISTACTNAGIAVGKLGPRPADVGGCAATQLPNTSYNLPNYCVGSSGYVYLHNSGSAGAPAWNVCLAELTAPYNVYTASSVCKPAMIKDSEGQIVSLYGYKLLSEFPNHTYSSPESFGTAFRSHDQPGWCGSCHPSRMDISLGGAYHAHPTGCSSCHGNPANNLASQDYPHTSTNDMLLKDYPDALCITCHTSGSLP